VGAACSEYRGEEGMYRVLMGKPDRKRPLGRSKHRWEDIMIDLEEVVSGDMDLIELAEDSDS
jgi:hypothetical protein